MVEREEARAATPNAPVPVPGAGISLLNLIDAQLNMQFERSAYL